MTQKEFTTLRLNLVDNIRSSVLYVDINTLLVANEFVIQCVHDVAAASVWCFC